MCTCASEGASNGEVSSGELRRRVQSRPSMGSDLWTGAFDVQIIVRTTERLGGLEHLDPLLGHLQGHVMGKIPEGALVTESISQYPGVMTGEGEVRRQADWNHHGS